MIVSGVFSSWEASLENRVACAKAALEPVESKHLNESADFIGPAAEAISGQVLWRGFARPRRRHLEAALAICG